MSGRRVALLFVYAFASMIVPVVVLLWVNAILNQALTNWIVKNLPVALVLIFVYAFGQLYIWTMMASWAAAVQSTTAERVSLQELKARLLSLNVERLPFKVVQDPMRSDRITASWKIVDEKWIEIFAACGLRTQYELRMKFLENKFTVLAQDNFRRLEYTHGIDGVRVKSVSKFSFFKGISFFQYERGAKYGIIYKDGKLKIDYAYNYRFNITEIKNPIIEVITGSGWEFRPTIFL